MTTIMEMLEPEISKGRTLNDTGDERIFTASEMFALSQAVSLKRIADALASDGSSFLTNLAGTLADASHDHAQRMS